MAQWTGATCQTNGIEMHYWRGGDGEHPVVLLHGFTDNGACWKPVAGQFAAEYDLIMPDARGHGKSRASGAPHGIHDHAADVIGLIEALELDKPVVAGHSMGGMAAALVAAERPDLVRGVILEDPAFVEGHGPRDDGGQGWMDSHRQLLQTPLETLEAEGQKQQPQWSSETIKLWASSKYETDLEAFGFLKEPYPEYRDVVKKLDMPTLLITGEAERGAIVNPEVAARLTAVNPQMRIEKIDGAGHCVRYDQERSFVEVMGAFLATSL